MGYATALLVGLLALIFSWHVFVHTQLEMDHVWVLFHGSGDLIGSLQEDDPVAIRGVSVGQVESIESTKDGVRVRVRFWKHQRLFVDAHATNVGNGLMGMRYMLLEPGMDSLFPLNRDGDIEGSFRPGIAEVMSSIEDLVAKVRAMVVLSRRYARGDSANPAFHRELLARADDVDTMLSRIDRISAKLERTGPKLQRMGRLGLNTARGVDSLMPTLLEGLKSTDSLLVKAHDLVAAFRGVAHRADTAVQAVGRPLEPFTRDDSLLVKIESSLQVVDQIQSFIDGKAKAKYNFHLWVEDRE